MADLGQAYTDKKIENLTHKINGIYKEARKDIYHKMQDFNEKYKVKEAKYAKQVADGKITQEQFDNWKKGQVFQGKQWQAKKDEINNVLHNSNVLAAQIINSERVDVFGFNMNYASYSMEHGTGVNFGFNIYDRNTVINLLKNEPNLLPAYTPKKGFDAAWNSKKITRQITLGIIEGEKLDQIADRLAKVTSSQDRNSMLTHARTLMTGAQNAGRLESYRQAEKLGIDMEKEWMATLDGHTRDSHADIDGERQPIEHKFSNDCMYPGDPGGPPAEVYNCRCTMVSNIKKYPAKYQRRDNINGKRVDQMTYKDWYKAKYGKDFAKKVKGAPKINYKKFGGKENFETLSKYNDWLDMLNKENDNQKYENVMKFFGDDTDKVNQAIVEAKQANEAIKIAEQEVNAKKIQSQVEAAQKSIDTIKAELEKMNTDYGVFSGIWYKDVTLADFGTKQHTIQSKYDWFDEELKKLYAVTNPTQTQLDKIDKFEYLKDLLGEYEKLGKEYLAKQKEVFDLQAEIKNLQAQARPRIEGDKFSQARKDAALWAQTSREADQALRPMAREMWQNATDAEKKAAYQYTAGSGPFNRPLRGYEGSWYNFKGVGNVDLNHEGAGQMIEDLTNVISRSTLKQDTWLQRAIESTEGTASFFQISESDLRNLGQEDLSKLLMGKEVQDQAFVSCGSAKGAGFTGTILNIYCPEGTQAIYCEPFSRFGNGDKMSWDGISDQKSFGSELETLLQRNSVFRVTKVEKTKYGQIYIDVEVVDQRP
jgi:hypothetical protein